jgi:hypothetical protein
MKDGVSQFQNFRVNFHKCYALFSTRLTQLGLGIASFAQDGFRKPSRVRTKRRDGFGFDFLERYHKDGDEFLNHIVQVTGDETWLSFLNVETKSSPSRGYTHSPK